MINIKIEKRRKGKEIRTLVYQSDADDLEIQVRTIKLRSRWSWVKIKVESDNFKVRRKNTRASSSKLKNSDGNSKYGVSTLHKLINSTEKTYICPIDTYVSSFIFHIVIWQYHTFCLSKLGFTSKFHQWAIFAVFSEEKIRYLRMVDNKLRYGKLIPVNQASLCT